MVNGSAVICPTHSVCMPLPCGLIFTFRKFTDPPFSTKPVKEPITTGLVSKGGAKKAFTLFSFVLRAIEISIGRDRSAWYCFNAWLMSACIYNNEDSED